MKRFP